MTIPASDLLTRLQALLAERDKWVLVSVVKKWDAEHKVFDLMPEIVAALSQQQEMQMPKRKATDDVVLRVIAAVFPDAPALARAAFDEAHILSTATGLIELLRSERDAALIKLADLEAQIQRVRAELANVGERE